MTTESVMEKECERALGRLLQYCRDERWEGHDPYDALNSALIRALTLNTKLLRTAATQLIKLSPANLRPLLGIRKGLNPKALALAARALILLSRRLELQDKTPGPRSSDTDPLIGIEADVKHLLTKLEELRSKDYSEACWGYNFDWQSRVFFAPRGTPNVVCTVTAAHAYLDWYERTGDEFVLKMATSSCRFLLDRINRTSDRDGFCFSYTPMDHSRVHNVNLLAAELLARVFTKTGSEEYRDAAERAARFTLGRQLADGSWYYGEAESQAWIDSFHTGFVIVSLKHLIQNLNVAGWRGALDAGYEFYEKRFFLADGTPGYYHDQLYPLDVHSAAQGVITFVEMTDLMPNANAMSSRVLRWALEKLRDPAGFFYFQRHRFYTIRIPFMRWAQTWMLYALSLYLSRNRITENVGTRGHCS